MIEESVSAGSRSSAAAPTVFLHIGTMKTGTSFIQRVLQRNRELLRAEGVLYPLDGVHWALQVRAARDILGIKGIPAEGAWPKLEEKIRAWNGRACVVSMEFYSLASAVKAVQVVSRLKPSEVQVIITARDLVRVIPSAWQSMVKQGRPWSFADFVAAVTGSGGDRDAHRRFWRHHDLVEITRKWTAAVGAQNVHVITVPPSGAPPSTLWERFCSVVDLDPERYDISQDRKSNFSLSFSDTELMRQINTALRDELGKVAYKRWATRYFANRVLRASAGEQTAHDRPALSAAAHEWAIERSRQMVVDMQETGVHIIGDLEELIPAPLDPTAKDADTQPTTVYPDGAATIIAALLRQIVAVDPSLVSGRHARAGTGGFDSAADPDDDVDDEGVDDVDDAYGDETDSDEEPRPAARLAWVAR